jgi:hypothetical protein
MGVIYVIYSVNTVECYMLVKLVSLPLRDSKQMLPPSEANMSLKLEIYDIFERTTLILYIDLVVNWRKNP